MPEFQSYNKKNKGLRQSDNGRPEPFAAERKPVPLKIPRKRKPMRGTSTDVNIRNISSAHNGKRRVRQSYVIHAALTAILFIGVVALLSVTVLFNADEVIIRGESLYSDEEILAAGEIETGVNLIRFNNERAEDAIINSLVCLDGVEVKKKFPASIIVTVEPAERVFSVKNQKTYLEISHKGRIININQKRPEGLVINGIVLSSKEEKPAEIGDALEGILEVNNDGEVSEEEVEKIRLIFELVELIGKHELDEIVSIDVKDRFDLKMLNTGEVHAGKVEVKLGTPTQLDEKLAIASKIIAEQIEGNENGTLRVSSLRKASFNPKVG
ncbi:MAG: FtsQ-type POTRA domain-containing protein [Oscillospiraceae bacterium]|nr:FtsQ-type POTRA domain-containing protein [Oscillospiraceae bacterium]